MSDKEEAINESREQEKQPELAVETFEDVIETQKAEAADAVMGVKEAGEEEISRIETDGLPEEVKEITEVAKEATEEATGAKEEYYEELRSSIPNFDDKVEEIKKEKEIEEGISVVAEETKESPVVTEVKTETTENPENEKSCPKCGALFPGTANFCGKCGTEFEKTKTEKVRDAEEVSEDQQREATEVEERKDGELFDRLIEINVSMKAIKMEDQEAAIELINNASSDLTLFIVNNQEAINNNKELYDMVKAAGASLKIAESIVDSKEKNNELSAEDEAEEQFVKEIDESQAKEPSDFNTKTENSGMENDSEDEGEIFIEDEFDEVEIPSSTKKVHIRSEEYSLDTKLNTLSDEISKLERLNKSGKGWDIGKREIRIKELLEEKRKLAITFIKKTKPEITSGIESIKNTLKKRKEDGKSTAAAENILQDRRKELKDLVVKYSERKNRK